MLADIDKIIYLCQQPRETSTYELKSMLLTLASAFKNFVIGFEQQSGQSSGSKFPFDKTYDNQNQGFINKQIYQSLNQNLVPQYQPPINYNNQTQINQNFPQNQYHQQVSPSSKQKIQLPIRLTYVNKINQWWPPEKVAASIGVPGYAHPTIYNCFALSFWTYGNGPVDIVCIWADPLKYLGDQSPFGSSKDQIQKSIKKKYNQKGIKLLISVFGATQFPTTANINPIDCAQRLGKFVNQNNLDGVDIDWEDNEAMEAGKGQKWIIQFQVRLRQLLPNHIISHAPQAPYFKKQHYKNGAYVTVNEAVGNGIDFYNVQFYNQGNTAYNTYETLFQRSGSYFSGTSVYQISARGIPLNKIVIGKPVTQADCCNSGLVDHQQLGQWIMKANRESRWCGGVMYWQYASDIDGRQINKSAGKLK